MDPADVAVLFAWHDATEDERRRVKLALLPADAVDELVWRVMPSPTLEWADVMVLSQDQYGLVRECEIEVARGADGRWIVLYDWDCERDCG